MAARLLFFGNERLATGSTSQLPIVKSLMRDHYDIAAIVLAQNDAGKSRKDSTPEIVQFAAEHNIPVLTPASLADARDELAAFKAEAAILAAYGKLVPQSIIDLFPRGIINVHPSLLPKHRGSIPIEAAILSGETTTGVSYMQLAAGMDSGPVFMQENGLFIKKATKQQLVDMVGNQAAWWLKQHLPMILEGRLQPAEQVGEPTYDKRIERQDGIIDWQKPAEQIEREVRAYAGWPRSRTQLAGRDVIITAASLLPDVGAPGSIDVKSGQLIVFCKWGALQIDKLILAGKKEMTGQAFIAGYKPTA